MAEPGWIDGDDFARGLVAECPECGEVALRHGECEECGYTIHTPYDYDDAEYDHYKDGLVEVFLP